MKKISIIVLSLLLVCSFFSSCENNVAPVESKVAAVNFSVADGRGLQELKPDFIPVNDGSLVWYYKADKTSDSNFKTGAASDWTLIGNDGKLTNKVIFSLGIWNIDLQARLADDTIMYEGSKVGIIIDDPNNTTTVSINVSASVSGQNGYIVLDDVYILEQNGTGRVAPNVLIVSVSGADSGTSYNLTDNENGTVDSDPISLAPGSYDVAVGYISGSIKNAGEIKTVQVYSGRTTTVTGYVDEMPGEVQFNPVADTGVAYPDAPVTDGSSTTFTVANVTPSGETAKSTTAVFEDGALSAGENYKLSTSVSNEIEKGDFNISTGSNTVASLDLSLTNGTEVVSTFNNKTVTITTYIAKGLSGVGVTGPAESTTTDVNYNPETGELTFTTNHFSKYVVTATGSYEAYNATSKKVYEKVYSSSQGVLSAITDASDGDIIHILKDIELSEKIQINKSVTIKGQSFSISCGSDLDRVIDIQDNVNAINLVISDLNIVGPTSGSYTRGLSAYNNTGDLYIEFNNCEVSASYYALNIAGENSNVKVVANNCVAIGWCAVQTWSSNSKYEFNNCELIGINDKGYDGVGNNDFGTVVINDGVNNTEFVFNNSVIKAKETTGNIQVTFDIRGENTNIVLNNSSIELEGENTYSYVDKGNNNVVTKDGNDIRLHIADLDSIGVNVSGLTINETSAEGVLIINYKNNDYEYNLVDCPKATWKDDNKNVIGTYYVLNLITPEETLSFEFDVSSTDCPENGYEISLWAEFIK